MNLYGQSGLAKAMNDQKNIERNYWRIFRELEEAKKTIDGLEADNAKLSEENKAFKIVKPTKKTTKKALKKPVAETIVEEDSSEED